MIRVARETDMPRLMEMRREFYEYSDLGSFSKFDPDRVAEVFTRAMGSDEMALFVAEDKNGDLVGFGMFGTGITLFDANCKTCQEMLLWVEPKHRRKGFATNLMERGARWGKDNGATIFQAGTQFDKSHGNDLFKKLGFVVRGHNYLREF